MLLSIAGVVNSSRQSGSVGLYAVQFAHLIGLKVAAVASPRNFDLLKSLGADVVFNVNNCIMAA